jgi:hypothetical protein
MFFIFLLIKEYKEIIETCISIRFIAFTTFMDSCDYAHGKWFWLQFYFMLSMATNVLESEWLAWEGNILIYVC